MEIRVTVKLKNVASTLEQHTLHKKYSKQKQNMKKQTAYTKYKTWALAKLINGGLFDPSLVYLCPVNNMCHKKRKKIPLHNQTQ